MVPISKQHDSTESYSRSTNILKRLRADLVACQPGRYPGPQVLLPFLGHEMFTQFFPVLINLTPSFISATSCSQPSLSPQLRSVIIT